MEIGWNWEGYCDAKGMEYGKAERRALKALTLKPVMIDRYIDRKIFHCILFLLESMGFNSFCQIILI